MELTAAEWKAARKMALWAKREGASRFAISKDRLEISFPDQSAVVRGLPKEKAQRVVVGTVPLVPATGGMPTEAEMLFASCPEPVTDDEIMAGGEPYVP